MIAYKNRFHGHRSLDYVYKRGSIVRGKFFNLKFTSNKKRTESRLAIVVSKKIFKSAVKRNLLRRRLYAVIGPRIPNFKQIVDVVVIITAKELINLKHKDLLSQLDEALVEAGFWSENKAEQK